MKRVYLIGHGNLEIKEFVDLLIKNNIKTLVDVRSIPYSKYNSQEDNFLSYFFPRKSKIH